MAEPEVDLDSIIDRLLEVRGSRPGKQVQLLEQEIRYLCTKAREIFISQPILLELEAPIKVRYQAFIPSMRLARRAILIEWHDYRSVVIFTVNTTISSVCSNTVDSLPRLTTSSLVIMLIEANSPSRLSVCS